ncbi:MAG: hypothetical protein V1870_04705 [Candidatus Aenigmatarchaeota archaeon]
MNWEKIAKRLTGLQTISSIMKILSIEKETTINYIHELRKRGYIKTSRGKNMIRIYEISTLPRTELGFPGLYDTINKYSRVKIIAPFKHRVHDKELSVEEAISMAIDTRDYRTILASLELFRHVKDWKNLYHYAKKHGTGKYIGALYDTARTCVKTRKIDRRIERNLLKMPIKEKYIIKNLRGNDFKNIEKKWDVFIPFNKADLMRYKE